MPQKSKLHPLPCLVSYLINLCSQGHLDLAITTTLPLLVQRGIRLNSPTISFLLQQCGYSRSIKLAKWAHLHLKLTGLKKPNVFISNHLIEMYFKCGNFIEARKVFDKMSVRNLYTWNNMLSGYVKLGKIGASKRIFDSMGEKDVVSWNTMIIGYAKNGKFKESLRFYREFRRRGIGFNEFSFAGVLTVCVKSRDLRLSRQVHCQVFAVGFLSNIVLLSSVLDAYSKCGEMSDASRLFDEMHIKDIYASTTLVSGFAIWGDMESAHELFNEMPVKNPVSWSALIAGYARDGQGNVALGLLSEMMVSHVRPDQFTFSSCLCACATVASLKHGKQIHAYLVRTDFRPNTIVVTSLIDMYTKCGDLEVGWRIFNLMGNKKDVGLWNTMISAFAHHGCGVDAMVLIDEMVNFGVTPDRISFIVILNACSHAGLAEDGLRHFKSMASDYGITPDQEHYACLLDLLGRAGQFTEMIDWLDKMPFPPDNRIWNALLGVCRIHGNMELGRKAAEHLIELEPRSSAAYVLLSSINGVLGKWESVQKVRQLMDQRRVKKERAISWLEVENKVHSFIVSDKAHPSIKRDILSLRTVSRPYGKGFVIITFWWKVKSSHSIFPPGRYERTKFWSRSITHHVQDWGKFPDWNRRFENKDMLYVRSSIQTCFLV